MSFDVFCDVIPVLGVLRIAERETLGNFKVFPFNA